MSCFNITSDGLPPQAGSDGKILKTDGSTASWESAEDAALPDQATHSGEFLTTDGSDASWSDLGLGTLSSQDSDDVTITGGSVTGITDLAVADGGTGASTASVAINNLLPSQSGNTGKYLTSDGSSSSWGAIPAPYNYISNLYVNNNTADITKSFDFTAGS